MIAAALKIPGAPDGTLLRVWQGPRDELPDALEEVDLPISQIEGVNDVVAAHLPQVSGSALVVLDPPDRGHRPGLPPRPPDARAAPWIGSGSRWPWRTGSGSTCRLSRCPPRCGCGWRGTTAQPANPSTLWLDSSLASDGADGAAADAAEYVARATGDPVAAISSTVAVDSVVDGSVLDPLAAPDAEGDGRVVVISTRTPDGATLRSVLATDDGRSNAGTVVAGARDTRPRRRDRRPGRAEDLRRGAGPGPLPRHRTRRRRAQLLATLPSPYPMSKETPFTGDTSIITLVDADAAAAFTLVLSDADGKEMYRGVAPVGTWLLDLSPRDRAGALSIPGWRAAGSLRSYAPEVLRCCAQRPWLATAAAASAAAAGSRYWPGSVGMKSSPRR